MFELKKEDYKKVRPLLTAQNELSVFSVIEGITKGNIYVNDISSPTATLIKTNECILVAGNPTDTRFNAQISTKLDFWDQLTPDSKAWLEHLSDIHPNPLIKTYKRCHYRLSSSHFNKCHFVLEDGFVLEKFNTEMLEKLEYENADEVLKWANSWGDIESFKNHGLGYYIRNDKAIVSWSVTDCCCGDTIAIGVHTDEAYRHKGFGIQVVSATVKACFTKGYQFIDWLCVATNKGSIAIAEKLGFQHISTYDAATSYAPIENVKDLTETQWHEWAEHLLKTSNVNDDALWDALDCYVKSNDVEKTISVLEKLKEKGIDFPYSTLHQDILEYQEVGLCSNFSGSIWKNFINNVLTKA